MRHWWPFERRWRDRVLADLAPGVPVPAPVWAELGAAAPPILRVGLRVAVWAVVVRGALGIGRVEALRRFDGSRWFLLRQIVVALRLVAGLAYGRAVGDR